MALDILYQIGKNRVGYRVDGDGPNFLYILQTPNQKLERILKKRFSLKKLHLKHALGKNDIALVPLCEFLQILLGGFFLFSLQRGIELKVLAPKIHEFLKNGFH